MNQTWKQREKSINQPFIDELRMEMTRARVTPSEAARRAGFTQAQVSDWLTGKVGISLARYVSLARAAGLDDAQLAAMIARAEALARTNSAAELSLHHSIADAAERDAG